MPEFAIAEGQKGQFTLAEVAPYQPTDAERRYLSCIGNIMSALVVEPPAEGALAAELTKLRDGFSKRLREAALRFIELPQGASRDAAALGLYENALRDEGIYADRRARLLRTPFDVMLEGNPATDLVILTRDVPISQEKQNLKVELDKASTVVKAVLGARDQTRRKGKAGIGDHNALKLADYMSGLAGIGRVGLMNADPTQVAFASLALNSFKDDFVAREGGIVKNAYVIRLGVAALAAILACLAGYLAVEWWVPALSPQKNFLWMFMGAAAGAWLSFSIRRPMLSFSDLAALDEGRLRPEVRIVFVIVLTAVVGLLFWTGLVSIKVGEFNTNFAGIGTRDIAVLIGAFCGLAERTLSTAVAKRAEDFALGVGGSTVAGK